MSARDPLDELARRPPPAAPPIAAVLEAELGALAPVTTRRPLRQVALLVAASLAYGAGVLAVASLRRDASELPMAWLVGAGLAWLAGFVLPVYVALVPRPGAMLGRWELAATVSIVMAIVFVVLGFVVHPSGPSSVQYGAADFARGHTCLELGLATALVPVIAGTMCLRGALPVGARGIAAALGAGGGSLGGLVLHLHCHVTDGLHVGAVHGGVVIVAALLAAAFVPRATVPG